MDSERFVFDASVARGYEAWYETPEGRRADALEKAALARLLQRFPGARSVLEVGAGTGHFTRWLRAEGFAAVGLDLSMDMLQQAREWDGDTWVRGDGCRLPFAQDAFDLVAYITTLEFLSCPGPALDEGLRVGQQGLLLGVLNRWSPLGIERRLAGLFQPSVYDTAHFYSVRELERLLRSLTGGQARLMWETTLLPAWWPKPAHNCRCGSFIAMALLA